MKSIVLLFMLSNGVFAQTYGYPEPNQGPDHGSAKNFGVSQWRGVESVGSELTVNGNTYSYIRNSAENFKLSRKEGGNFLDVILKLPTRYTNYSMDKYSRLLNIYEDKDIINIYCWGVSGYHFYFYQKGEIKEPRLIRFGYIRNAVHSMEGFDDSIKSIEFTRAAQMKITKDQPTEAQRKLRPYLFTAIGTYEIRPEGVYLNGIFDPSVADHEPQEIVAENIQKDPQHYLKKQALHAERVASYTKEIMDAEAARVAALAPQPTPKPSVNPTPPEPNPEPTVAPSPIPKTPAATTESESSSNLTPWLAGIVALFVMLLGYLGLRCIRKKTQS